MADKQATLYIIDVGRSMGQTRHGRSETDLEFTMRYVWDRITTTVSNGRKTDLVGVVAVRTDGSENELAQEEDYEHISVLAPLSQFLMPRLRELQLALQPSSTNHGDGISALIIGVQLIASHCKKLKYIKSIVFVTNGTGSFDTDGIENVVAEIKAQNINLTVLGVDFDDEEYGVKEEGKAQAKRENEKVLKELAEATGGGFGTIAEAVAELGRPRLKAVRPMASYKGKLTLGDATKYDTALAIDVERYPRTAVAKPVSCSRYYVTTESKEGEGEESAQTMPLEDTSTKDIDTVKQQRTYEVRADNKEGKMEIDKDATEKGYKYGRTVVPVSQTDEEVAILETEPNMDIIGFIPAEGYKRYFHMSTTNAIVPQKGNSKAAVALSSLIHALYELESYALVRFVKKRMDAPVMMVLAPEIEADFECLIDVQVPFIEDVRPYRFPPLGKVKTVTGKALVKHRNIPTDDMEKFMSDYVDSMDISEFGKDDDGEPMEYAPVEDTYSPIIHRINQIIKHRAIHPKDPLPPPYDILLKYSHPPEEAVESSRKHLDKLINACDVKKVDVKARSKKREREQPKPKSGLDLEALLSATPASKKPKISLENAIPEFKQKLGALQEESEFHQLGTQMFDHVKELVKSSLADLNYNRACEILRVVREEFRDYEFADIYNAQMRALKKDIIDKKLDGDRNDMLQTIRKFNLGLITTEEAGDTSDVTEDQAAEFWKI